MKYIDLHCDTLAQAFANKMTTVTKMPEHMVDIERLHKANVMAQFFAIFLPQPGDKAMSKVVYPGDDAYIDALISIMEQTIKENPDKIALARNIKELEENNKAGKVSAVLTIEDGRSVNGKMQKIEEYYEKGIRLISLTWNFDNCFGAANSIDYRLTQRGLSSFGKDAVKHMEELGMLVDVSHLSDGGFYDVADILDGPFVASHSNCREITYHPRNLTDDMIRILGDKGGIAGINLFAKFLNENQKTVDSKIEDMIAHIHHLVRFGGEDIISLGTDFDGISGDYFEVGNPLEVEKLFAAMKKAGYTERQIEKFAYKNALRVIRDVLK